jgi:hypothetical protein
MTMLGDEAPNLARRRRPQDVVTTIRDVIDQTREDSVVIRGRRDESDSIRRPYDGRVKALVERCRHRPFS